jgi:hypothetical protein
MTDSASTKISSTYVSRCETIGFAPRNELVDSVMLRVAQRSTPRRDAPRLGPEGRSRRRDAPGDGSDGDELDHPSRREASLRPQDEAIGGSKLQL